MIYLASPYSDDDPEVRERRFHHALNAATDLSKKEVVFSPIVYGHFLWAACANEGIELPFTFEYWESLNNPMIAACDTFAVLMLSGWENSLGVGAELALAQRLRKKIVYMKVEISENN